MNTGQKVKFIKSSGIYIGIGEEGTCGKFITEVSENLSLITAEGFWGEETLAFKNEDFIPINED